MATELTWDEAKRIQNLEKHGLDFANAGWVLDSIYRFDTPVRRNGENRIQSFAYVFGKLAVLLVVHAERGHQTRVISFRHASQTETEVYYEWLRNEYANP